MRNSIFVIFGITILGFLYACGPAPLSPEELQLGFLSNRASPKLEIFLTDLRSDSVFVKEIFGDTAADIYNLCWVEDGRSLLFAANPFRNQEIFYVNVQKGGLTNKTQSPARERDPHASSDDRQIVFISSRDHPAGEIYIMNFDGSNLQRLTENEIAESFPRFSPDGLELAFTRALPLPGTESVNGEIIRMDIHSRKVTRITNKSGFDAVPDWSPDGKKITFHGCTDQGCQIFTIKAGGSDLKNISNDQYDNRWPRWSPDGYWIAYTSIRNGQSDIFVMRTDGSEKKRITSHPGRDEVAEWRVRPGKE